MLSLQGGTLREHRLIGQGRQAEVFEWSDGLVLRLLRAPGDLALLASEVAALEAARSAGVPVPRPNDGVVVDGRPGLLMEYLRGPDLLTRLGRKPWLVFSTGRLAGEVHARINAARAPASLPSVREVVGRGLTQLESTEPRLAEWVGRTLARLPDGDALCHGDFHPGQLMFSGDHWAVFDWSEAKRGDALFDYARTRVLLSIGEPPPGTATLLSLLAKIGRRLLISSYARAYELHTPQLIDKARLGDWEIVNLAMRVLDEVPGERPRLLRRLHKALGRAEAQ